MECRSCEMVESVMVGNNDIRRAISGDREALGNLLEQVGPVVRRDVAARIPAKWRSLLSADDVMQQTYADAFRGITRFVPLGDGAFRAWLASLAKCNVRDALKMLQADKRGGNRCRVDPNGDGNSYLNLFDVLSSSGTSPTKQVARSEAAEKLEKRWQRFRTPIRKWCENTTWKDARPRTLPQIFVGRPEPSICCVPVRTTD